MAITGTPSADRSQTASDDAPPELPAGSRVSVIEDSPEKFVCECRRKWTDQLVLLGFGGLWCVLLLTMFLIGIIADPAPDADDPSSAESIFGCALMMSVGLGMLYAWAKMTYTRTLVCIDAGIVRKPASSVGGQGRKRRRSIPRPRPN